MKAEKTTTTKEVKEERILVKYTQEDIEQLIRVDLLNQGYEVDNITIITDMKYVEDEWGNEQISKSLLQKCKCIGKIVSCTLQVSRIVSCKYCGEKEY